MRVNRWKSVAVSHPALLDDYLLEHQALLAQANPRKMPAHACQFKSKSLDGV